MEYPGYSLYEGKPSEETIFEDSEALLKFCRATLGFESQKIMVVGRSLGSGPAIYLTSRHRVGMLTLISPFMSVRAAAKDIVGSIGQYFINERFDNLSRAEQIKCSTLLIHG